MQPVISIVIVFLTSLLVPKGHGKKREIGNILQDIPRTYDFIPYLIPKTDASTGTIFLGGPNNLSYGAFSDRCFSEESIERHYNKRPLRRKFQSSFQGGLKVLGLGLFSGKIKSSHQVNIVIDGITIESIPLFDVKRLVEEVMDDYCIEALNYSTGFVMESLIVEKIEIFITDNKGVAIKTSKTNLFGILADTDISWYSKDEYSLIITTPTHLGYKLAQLRQTDRHITVDQARSFEKNNFIFERLLTIKRTPFSSRRYQ